MKSKEIFNIEQTNLSTTIQTIEMLIEEYREKERIKRNDLGVPGNSIEKNRISKYSDARKNLYYGRVDVVEDNQVETYYIGDTPVVVEDTENIICDWRSPFGDAFHAFFGGNGKITYQVDNQFKNEITVMLKRELSIKHDRLLDYNDLYSDQAIKTKYVSNLESNSNQTQSDSTYTDQFLSNLLNESRDGHGLKKVIATIRKEQNEVIRLGIQEPVLIQGVAGSGKSTIALNRISFLLYRYRETLLPENILILAPNKMFLSYIKGILPGLDIEGIQQHTFTTLSKKIIPKLGKIMEPYHTLAAIVNEDISEDEIVPITTFKGSFRFKQIIDSYISHLEDNLENSIQEFTIKDLFNLEEQLFSKEQIKEKLKSFSYLPIEKRRKEVFKNIENWKSDLLSRKLDKFEKEFEASVKLWVNCLPKGSDLRKQTFEVIEKVYKYKYDLVKNDIAKTWKEYNEKVEQYTSKTLLQKILNPDLFKSIAPDVDDKIITSLRTYSGNKVQYEDLAALLYLEHKINSLPVSFDYIVVDEAQDLSAFQIYVLKLLSKSMTILGDVTQSVYSYTGISNWNELKGTVWNDINQTNLNISYRSTFEIMNAANQIITNGNLPYEPVIPFNRKGEEVICKQILDEEDLLENILTSIKQFLNAGYQKIAIIHKDARRSEGLYNLLKQSGMTSVQLVSDSDINISESITVIPSYLVKGLEFDAVIIPNANEENYKNEELDAKLLFVSLTRPHHALHIFYHRVVTPLLATMVKKEKIKRERIGIL
jgi:DNA helicase II / ATP-dependent DNA helicase PcrA